MKPSRIILVRHGESEGNVSKNVDAEKADYTLQLTDVGKSQATEAGLVLKQLLGAERVFFYVSPLWRTRMTFEHIATSFDAAQYQYREEPRLREQEWGHLRSYEECMRIDRERESFGTFYYRIPDGESAADVYDRVSDFFGTLHRDFQKSDYPPNVCIVTHGMTIRLFLMRWFHWTVEKFEMLANPVNCGVVVLEQNAAGKFELKTELVKRKKVPVQQRPIKLLPHE